MNSHDREIVSEILESRNKILFSKEARSKLRRVDHISIAEDISLSIVLCLYCP